MTHLPQNLTIISSGFTNFGAKQEEQATNGAMMVENPKRSNEVFHNIMQRAPSYALVPGRDYSQEQQKELRGGERGT